MNQTQEFFTRMGDRVELLPEPPRPTLVYSRPDEPAQQDELAFRLELAGRALFLAWINLRLAAGIICRRAINSLRLAWVLAGFGWGAFLCSCIAFPLIFHFAR
jgi:hypothetical protein